MTSSALVLLAKYPEPGAVKTRLVIGTTETRHHGLKDSYLANGERIRQADAYALSAELYRAFLKDRFNAHRGRDYALFLATTQPERREEFRTITGDNVRSQHVNGRTIGEMLVHIFRALLDRYQKVLVSGSDFPYLPEPLIERVYRQLDSDDVVLIPAYDGAYNLIGMRRFYDIFNIPRWSAGSELHDTIQLLRSQSIPHAVFDDTRLLDIDTIDDLKMLMGMLHEEQAPITFAKLQEIRDRLRFTADKPY